MEIRRIIKRSGFYPACSDAQDHGGAVRESASARSQQDETGVGESARWILLLPLAALCAAIAYGASAIGLTTLGYALLGPATSSVPTVAAVASTVASAAMAYIFVWTAVVIAPSSRARVAQ